jgi:hypothetical protein
MRSHGALLALAVLTASCAGVPESVLAPAPAPAPEAAAPAPVGLLLPEDPLAAAREAFRAHPEGIRLLVVVSPT